MMFLHFMTLDDLVTAKHSLEILRDKAEISSIDKHIDELLKRSPQSLDQ